MAWPKLTKNANFGPNLVVFGQKILFFTGEIKSFVTNITINPPRHLVHILFWSDIGSNAQKNNIWPEMPIMGQIWLFLGQKSIFWGGLEWSFWYSHIREPMKHLFRVENIDRCGSNWPLGTKMCNFGPKIWIFGAKSHFFV